jgi:lysine 2,3-aminomutase
VVPRVQETQVAPWEMSDPCGEDQHSPVPGLVHRYPDRVLFLVTDRCASYCRYCTRSRLVSNASGYDFHPQFDRQIDYISRHPEIRDVLLSGGDALLFSDERLEFLLSRLRAIKHVEFLRIGTRIPIFLPQRITLELCAMLKGFHPLFISIHSNHPRELTTEVREGLGRLADAGIPLGNQSVLLRHVNDKLEVMKAHVQKLLMCRVRPYYIYQCDLISGSAHLRASVREGLQIMEGLRGHTSGYAVPQYVIDAPGGGGKVPINPEYVLSRNADRVVIRNFEGKVFEYLEAADGSPLASEDQGLVCQALSADG